MIVHADKSGPHVAKCVTGYMDHNSLKRHFVLPAHLISQHLIFYLFRHAKHQLQGQEFTKGTKLVLAISENLNQIPTKTLVDVFDDWMRRL
jgi:hypothetical protein